MPRFIFSLCSGSSAGTPFGFYSFNGWYFMHEPGICVLLACRLLVELPLASASLCCCWFSCHYYNITRDVGGLV
jgi:hypothetical protein